MTSQIQIDPDRATDVDYLMEEVIFPVVVLGHEEPQLMSATRFDCIKHHMELGIYDVITVQGHERLYMIEDGEGTKKFETVKGQEKEGKTVSSIITGKKGYVHKDEDPFNCLTVNFVSTKDQKRKF